MPDVSLYNSCRQVRQAVVEAQGRVRKGQDKVTVWEEGEVWRLRRGREAGQSAAGVRVTAQGWPSGTRIRRRDWDTGKSARVLAGGG